MREADVLSNIKAEVPNAWRILEMEISRARSAMVNAVDSHASHNLHSHDALDHPPLRSTVRKRVKLRVPAEQYPDYNFVGRLLGPRGATLKRLERDTGCRIMIRGKGSIRKDKEAEVRGKPGWEHVFHEPLHVVIEVVDATDEVAAQTTLQNAKDLVDILLIPVPEERDSLKRAQLRDLAILNGTHRSVSDLVSASVQHLGISNLPRTQQSPLASSPPPLRRAHSQITKPTPKMYNNDYPAMFEAPGAFSRHNTSSTFSPAPNRPPHTSYQSTAYPSSNTQQSLHQSSDHFLPDLEKLRIPALDFDHLNDSSLASTASAFPMPSPSPTIVDPEIYPYPPTPGLMSIDQQLSAFGSPMWTPNPTPSRPQQSSGSLSSSLPPRSPPAVGDTNTSSGPGGGGGGGGASFLLGRALDHQRHQSGGSRDSLPFEQAFASQVSYAETDGDRLRKRQASPPPQQHPFAAMKNANGDSIILSNLFPNSATVQSTVETREEGAVGSKAATENASPGRNAVKSGLTSKHE